MCIRVTVPVCMAMYLQMVSIEDRVADPPREVLPHHRSRVSISVLLTLDPVSCLGLLGGASVGICL